MGHAYTSHNSRYVASVLRKAPFCHRGRELKQKQKTQKPPPSPIFEVHNTLKYK